MKKISIILAALFMMNAATSCKKSANEKFAVYQPTQIENDSLSARNKRDSLKEIEIKQLKKEVEKSFDTLAMNIDNRMLEIKELRATKDSLLKVIKHRLKVSPL